tara:strand:+ start:111 stop:716 length:606 start_codon:yes stop_codon:yes gene_type:complete
VEEGVRVTFQIPMAHYENKSLTNTLSEYILSKETKGIESGIAPKLKHNLVASKSDFLYGDAMIVKDTKQWIDECIKKTINTIQMEDIDYKITYNESWYHVTTTNGMHEPHIHPRCSWCGVYYIKSGNHDSGDTVFENPVKSTYIDRGNLFLDHMHNLRIKPQDGLLVIFPSYLSHYQALYKGTEDRIVVAFNASIDKREED